MTSRLTPPDPQWNERTREMYARWFADVYYIPAEVRERINALYREKGEPPVAWEEDEP